MVDFDEVLRVSSARFRAALADAPGDAPVPSCPQWTAADLLWHLTEVQDRWATIVEARALTRDEAFQAASPERPVGHAESLELFDRGSARLAAALSAARDDEPAWTWSTEQSIGWIRRRQAHEALIHRVDAELVGAPGGARAGAHGGGPDGGGPGRGIEPAVAEDGVDEVLTKFGAAIPEWGSFDPCGPLLEVRSQDSGRRWWVRLGRFRGVDSQGTAYDEPDFVPVGAPPGGAGPGGGEQGGPVAGMVAAPAAELLLWLWGRASGRRVEGDPGVLEQLRAAVAANTQ